MIVAGAHRGGNASFCALMRERASIVADGVWGAPVYTHGPMDAERWRSEARLRIEAKEADVAVINRALLRLAAKTNDAGGHRQ